MCKSGPTHVSCNMCPWYAMLSIFGWWMPITSLTLGLIAGSRMTAPLRRHTRAVCVVCAVAYRRGVGWWMHTGTCTRMVVTVRIGSTWEPRRSAATTMCHGGWIGYTCRAA